MFKIGDFSKLSQVSVKTLRYYDQIGLLKPTGVDEMTGYRYYTAGQLPRLNRILALKDLGFSLEQITTLVKEEVPISELRGMLRLKRAEMERTIQDEQERLRRVEARLRQLEDGDSRMYDVVLKRVEPMRVASIRTIIPTSSDVEFLFNELLGYMAAHNARAIGGVSIWYDGECKQRETDAEAAIETVDPLPENERVKVRQLPGVDTMACITQEGDFERLTEAYGALMLWIERNGYRINGLTREVYIRYGSRDPAKNVAEVQIPVKKI
jgi:DNA-binding transcriptional MerR regulator